MTLAAVGVASRRPGSWSWDARPLLRQVDDDLELARDLVEMFLEDSPAMVARIRQAACKGDGAGLTRWARAFGSSAAAIGAEAWVRTARGLERKGRAGRVEEAESGIVRFEERVARLESQLAEALGR